MPSLRSHFTLRPEGSKCLARVCGFACVAGSNLLGKDMTPMNAIMPTIGSIIFGAGFGGLSEMIGGKLANS